MSTSTVLVVPSNTQDAANKFFCAIGQDVLPGFTFTRKLSASGSDPATHYACHTYASDDLLTTLTAIRTGTMGPLVPNGVVWSDWGTTENDVLAFGQSLSIHLQGEPQIQALAFFENVLAGLELTTVAEAI